MPVGLGASASADRAGGPADLSRKGVSAGGAHPLREDIIFAVDDHNRWHVFDRRAALGTFDTWAEADTLRNTIATTEQDDSGPAWTPKSGGY